MTYILFGLLEMTKDSWYYIHSHYSLARSEHC